MSAPTRREQHEGEEHDQRAEQQRAGHATCTFGDVS
jgi:hypothetical protein